jgi:hypothetical protein
VPDLDRQRLAFLPGIAAKMGWYVYALRDPRDSTVFYVGKGVGNRAYQHARHALKVRDPKGSLKLGRIAEIHAAGREVVVEIARHGLPDEPTAYLVEAAVIDALKIGHPADLTNVVAGHGRDEHGWASLEKLRALAATTVEIAPEHRPCLLIRPRRLYRFAMNAEEMWEVTRKAWRMQRRTYRHAFCVHDGIVRGVWRVTGWDDEASDWSPRGRRALLGEPAEDLWPVYVGSYVGHYLPPQGGRIPFTVLR